MKCMVKEGIGIPVGKVMIVYVIENTAFVTSPLTPL